VSAKIVFKFRIWLCFLLLLPLTVSPASTQVGQAPSPQLSGEGAVKSEEMQAILRQPVGDYALREASASADVKRRLDALRNRLREQKAQFDVGYTTAFDVPLKLLAGTSIPELPPGTVEAINVRAQQLERIDIESAKESNVNIPQIVQPLCSPNQTTFDWRRAGKVTPVRTQICGTCWDFTAMGAYEGSYALRNSQLVDTSEQYVLNCAAAGSCSGGWWMPVFDFLISHGTATEASDPFTGNDTRACPANMATPYRAASWGFVANSQWTIPSAQTIKQALCTHGPLATAVMVDEAFQGYTGGANGDQVFDEHTVNFGPRTVNHGIVIIGWDEGKKAWLIRNSWGPGWGASAGYGSEKGYMWIAYNTNNVGIATAWVDAVSTRYRLKPQWMELLENLKINVNPLPKQ
jgi:hypothetical protein